MKYLISLLLVILFEQGFSQTIQSPDHRLKLTFSLSPSGELAYQLAFGKTAVVKFSKLGLELKGQRNLLNGFSITKIDSSLVDGNWNPVWGEVKTIRNHYRELAITLLQKETSRTMRLRFRLFNDGLGFRYEFPNQPKLTHFVVAAEKTEFNMAGDHKAFWIPGDYDTNEYSYFTTKLSETSPETTKKADEIAARFPIANAVQTPL